MSGNSLYPMHAVVDEDADGLLVDGVRMTPWQKMPVGRGWAHVPILHRPGATYKQIFGSSAPPAVDPEFNAVDLTICAFLNGRVLAPISAATMDRGPASATMRLVGDGWEAYTEFFNGVDAAKIQFRMKVPLDEPVQEMGLLIRNFAPLDNLACEFAVRDRSMFRNRGMIELTEAAAEIGWTGWAASTEAFAAIRNAAECFPRGWSTENDGSLKLYLHKASDDSVRGRVRSEDLEPEQIVKLKYLRQGPLSPWPPIEVVAALEDDPRLSELNGEMTPQNFKSYRPALAASLDVLFTRFSGRLGLDARPNFEEWARLHQEKPAVILVNDLPRGIVDADELCARSVASWPGQMVGQFIRGDWRHFDDGLNRVRGCNHYFNCSTAWTEAHRQPHRPEVIEAARTLHEFFRDSCCAEDGQYAHGKTLAAYTFRNVVGHHVDADAHDLAWRVDRDWVSRRLYELSALSISGGRPDREMKNSVVQYERRHNTVATVARQMLEAVQLEVSGDGWLWPPDWMSEEYAKRQSKLIAREGIWAFDLARKQGDPMRMIAVASWLVRNYPDGIPKAGPIGDGWFVKQWPLYLGALLALGITKLPLSDEVGDYPMLQTRIEWFESKNGVEVVFEKKTTASKTLKLTIHAIQDGDVHPTLARLWKPTGEMVRLVDAMDRTAPVRWRPSGRAGHGLDFVVNGPIGRYRLGLNSHAAGAYGNITGGPEYCVVKAGAVSGMHDGWWLPMDGTTPREAHNGSAGCYKVHGGAYPRWVWPTAGYFAARREWLPGQA